MKTSRKDELLKELNEIQKKNLADHVKGLGYTVTPEQKAHNRVMYFDLFIKLAVAIAVSISFVWIVYTGNVEAMKPVKGLHVGGNSGNFQLLSVVGPLFGMVMSYYFGKSKASANGE